MSVSLQTEPGGELSVMETDETSSIFMGQWRGLVSTTNWEKGKIISQWRDVLREAGASSAHYSDEAWSRRVGQVSSQHVGRLRRVFQRFEPVREQFPGLYWSHFQAALDWSDAEMWLEGAVQSDWSVGDMRSRRWEATGQAAADRPAENDVVEAEFDEDGGAPDDGDLAEVRDPGGARRETAERWSPADEAEKSDNESEPAQAVPFDLDAADYPAVAEAPPRPFANLAALPDELAEAFEGFKLAILHHKLAGWRDITRDDVLASLDSLKQLALTPSDQE
jgi:hypothetical protein